MFGLSVVIITRNEEKIIQRCLDSVKPIASEIVVVDSVSGDRTPLICGTNGCRVYTRDFDGYGTQKQFAVDQATHDWVLSIDADEIVSEDLVAEIKEVLSGPFILSGYRIPFTVFYLGKMLKHSGVGHERHLRLFDRTKGGFTKVPVHEGIEVEGATGTLRGKIIHYPYRDISHHLEKINRYTSQAAEGYCQKGKTFSRCWPFFKFLISFISYYFIKKGFLDGYAGFMWSFLSALYASLKIAKTIELNPK